MTGPELSVVCKSCGSEVSPYVTECPYCGHRLRKRAPALERTGDGIQVRESRRERRKRERRSPSPTRFDQLDARPWATIATLALSAALIVVIRAVPLAPSEAGAIVGPVGGEVWRYLTAPFVYFDLGAFFVVALAVGIFGSAVEARLGTVATALLILASGTLGMLGAAAAASAGLDDFLLAAGGSGVALGLLGAWLALRRSELEGDPIERLDLAAPMVTGVVLLLLPLVEVTAAPIAGLVGAIVGYGFGGLAAGRAAAR